MSGRGQFGLSFRSRTNPDMAKTWQVTYPRFEKIRILIEPERFEA